MGRDLLKLALIGGLIVFAVMYGMELANSGINTVYGPVDKREATTASQPQATGAPQRQADVAAKDKLNGAAAGNGRSDGRYADEPPGLAVDGAGGTGGTGDGYAIPRDDHQPAVDRLAGKTAEALQSISKGGIRLIVSLFDKVAG
ncbi:hypothetical protein [Cohnella nanjingensis]|uniref:Translation initiation factor 2 n=1 Tax=Cohnella nanjingensis TaxID=1387779 RepID=A0A7X0RUJ6_9BACL|nr:hypothetical protein [Cohnella nanjingensis]MBB6673968.1 hypothetical protein [Cohnella nanjingensis]